MKYSIDKQEKNIKDSQKLKRYRDKMDLLSLRRQLKKVKTSINNCYDDYIKATHMLEKIDRYKEQPNKKISLQALQKKERIEKEKLKDIKQSLNSFNNDKKIIKKAIKIAKYNPRIIKILKIAEFIDKHKMKLAAGFLSLATIVGVLKLFKKNDKLELPEPTTPIEVLIDPTQFMTEADKHYEFADSLKVLEDEDVNVNETIDEEQIKNYIKLFEGYNDVAAHIADDGHITVGYGHAHLASGNSVHCEHLGKDIILGETRITKEEGEELFDYDYRIRMENLDKQIKDAGLDGVFNNNQKAVLLDMAYNFGNSILISLNREGGNILNAYQKGYKQYEKHDAVVAFILNNRSQGKPSEWGNTGRRMSNAALYKYGNFTTRETWQNRITEQHLRNTETGGTDASLEDLLELMDFYENSKSQAQETR